MGFNGTVSFGSTDVAGKYHHLAEVVVSAHGLDDAAGSFVVQVFDDEQSFKDGAAPIQQSPAMPLPQAALDAVRDAASALVYAEAMARVPDAVLVNKNPERTPPA
jgi:hypothetical protein